VQEATEAAARQDAAAAAQLQAERGAVERLSAEAAAAKSIIDALKSQVELLTSLDARTQSEIQKLQSDAVTNASQLQECTGEVVKLKTILAESMREAEAANAACSALQADREERDRVLRELVEENDGLQRRVQEATEAAARQDAAAAAQLQAERGAVERLSLEIKSANQANLVRIEQHSSVVLDLKSQIDQMKSHLELTASAENLSKLRFNEELVHSQKEVIALTSRLNACLQQISDLQLENTKLGGSVLEMRAVLNELVGENDRLTRVLNTNVAPGTPQAELIAKRNAFHAEHELLLSALRRFWDAVGVLPTLSNLSLEEHGVILDAVVALQTYLGAINLLDSRLASQHRSALQRNAPTPKFNAAQQGFGVFSRNVEIGFSTPSNKMDQTSRVGSGSIASDLSPKRRSLFCSITKRRS
jgi:chromosome segregation ATPase